MTPKQKDLAAYKAHIAANPGSEKWLHPADFQEHQDADKLARGYHPDGTPILGREQIPLPEPPPTGSCLICGGLRPFKAWSGKDRECGVCSECHGMRQQLDRMIQVYGDVRRELAESKHAYAVLSERFEAAVREVTGYQNALDGTQRVLDETQRKLDEAEGRDAGN